MIACEVPTVTAVEAAVFARRIRRWSEVESDRLINLALLAQQAVFIRGVPGSIVECGVAAGGSAAMLAWSVRASDRHLWLYDSFKGLPKPSDRDGQKAQRFTGANRCSPNRVREALAEAGYPADRTHLCEGWFSETFREPGPDAIAILHIDADWYDSVRLCLSTFYDRVAPGGVIVLDDFGYWPGCRHALYECCAGQGIAPDLQRFSDQAWWVKNS